MINETTGKRKKTLCWQIYRKGTDDKMLEAVKDKLNIVSTSTLFRMLLKKEYLKK